MGYTEVSGARVGKLIDLELADGDNIGTRVAEMAERLLANPVIETYSIEVMED